MSQPKQEPLLDIARGDAARSYQLRQSLNILRDRTDNPEFRKLLDDVLAGRRGLRDAARSPLFDQAITPRVQQAVARLHQMSDEEKQQLAEEGERRLHEVRDQANTQQAPTARQPETRRRPQPGDDIDDEDFRDRSYLQERQRSAIRHIRARKACGRHWLSGEHS